ncbi:MAG TPA: hydantoinase/oxoprolinase family protein [Acidimicrobiales bacterium]|nr:hydantoinase/oxoprolinase family protein [Acidimicrobiales bacterium]
MSGYRIGIDVGGTFTDLVARRPDGSVVLEKSPTTPTDQSQGVLAAVGRLAEAEGTDVASLLAGTDGIVHGTTTGDNTMIQMTGAKTGLIVTAGFRDEIEMRRCFKEDIWDPALEPPAAIAPRRVRLEVRERLNAEGEVVDALNEEDVRRAARRLEAFGVRSIAIVFLHSYINPAHELRARELVLEEYPAVEQVSMSHEVLPKPPEFERTSTTLVNAYVGPPIARYLGRLEDALRGAGFTNELLIATSAGGVATPAALTRRAVATIGSGPTGGAAAAARAAAAAGLRDVVSVDMGGTSYDVCLIRDGRAEVTADWNWRHRYCIALPMVDIHSIGAGGGSVAYAQDGVLHVGPRSAGSEPGPVCYGRGGTEPCVTDADLVLGRLDPAGFYGGRMALDVDAARKALEALAFDLGMGSAADAAAAVSEIVDAHMTDAIRRVLSLAGADPRRLDLVAFGGMGAVHATAQAAALGMGKVLVPLAAPGFSALGLLTADHVVDNTRGYITPWRDADPARVAAMADELESNAVDELRAAGVAGERIRLEWYANLVYPGQTFDVPIPCGRPTASNALEVIGGAVAEFHRRNEEARLIEARAQEPLFRGLRLTGTGMVEQPAPLALPAVDVQPEPIARRRLFTAGTWFDDTPVFDGHALRPGPAVHGPAVVQYRFTTLVLRPGDRAEVLPNGDALVDVGPLL